MGMANLLPSDSSSASSSFLTPRAITMGVASSDSPIRTSAAEARSSASAWDVTFSTLPKRSDLPLISSTASIPDEATATPVVPFRVGESLLSQTTTPTDVPLENLSDSLILLAETSDLIG